MSWKASAWAKDQRLGSPSAKSILMCLADYADPEGVIRGWASQSDLADAAEVSERTAREWLQRLEDWGLVERQRQQRPSGARAADHIVLRFDRSVTDGTERCRRLKYGDEDVDLPANSAGRSYRQPDAEPTGNQTHPTGNQFRAYKDNPPLSTQIPPVERDARASEQEDPKKVEAEGWALLKNWPGFDGMPKEPALAIWRTLSAEERTAAFRRFLPWLELLRRQKKSHIPAPSTYLRERLFEAVADPADAPPPPQVAAPFGKLWGVLRTAALVVGPGPLPRPSGFIAQLIEQGGEAGERERLRHRATHGWPVVKRMDEQAANRRGWTVRPEDAVLERLAEAFEAVRVGSDVWTGWHALFEARGWPWLPDPGRQDWVYFPAGGPEGMSEFEAAVRSTGEQVHEAAE